MNRLNRDDEHDLVRDSRAGDIRSFAALIRRHQMRIRMLARRLLKNDADAQDVAQTAFMRALDGIRCLQREATFSGWLSRIAVNLALDVLRDRRRSLICASIDIAVTGVDPVVRGEDDTRALRALQLLPPKQRRAIELRLFEELSFREVARAIDTSEASAKMNYHHGLKRLRALLGS